MKIRIKSFLNKSVLLIAGLLLFLMSGCGSDYTATEFHNGKPTVEFLYLEHPPVKPVIQEVEKTIDKYKDQMNVVECSFDSKEGQDLAKKRNITEHTPIAIFINGSMTANVNGHDVKFFSFPQGQSTMMMGDGGWTYQDLDAALAQAVGGKKQ